MSDQVGAANAALESEKKAANKNKNHLEKWPSARKDRTHDGDGNSKCEKYLGS